jgi:RNA polymerase sigma-70 factor, ECF subfamily
VDDNRLLERMRRGDQEAFASLYAAHKGPIYRYAMRMCGRAAADDIVQETFLGLMRQPDRYEAARGTVSSYLFGIARHHILKRLAISHAEFSVEDDPALAERGNGGAVPSPLEELTRAEVVNRVRAAVQSLPPAYREVVALCELQEMNYADAAAIIECPVGTIRSRLHRAKALLLTKLSAVPSAALIGKG